MAWIFYLNCGQGSHDGRRAEAVRDEGEVRERPLDARVKNLLRSSVAQRRAVLIQQIHELLGNHPAIKSGLS